MRDEQVEDLVNEIAAPLRKLSSFVTSVAQPPHGDASGGAIPQSEELIMTLWRIRDALETLASIGSAMLNR